MPKTKLFTGGVLLLAVLLAASGVMAKPLIWSWDDRPVIQLANPPAERSAVARDEDDFMTFRWVYSSDGGEHWSGIMGAGNTGMIDTTGGVQAPTAWGGASYDFGAVVDNDNNIHFVAVLNSYLDGVNPLDRRNGVYDVKASADGETVSYNLIAEQGEGHDFIWSDCGKNADGHIFAIWVDVQGDVADINGAKSTDGGANWSDPVVIKNDLDVTGGQESVFPFAHMTPTVDSDFFYIIYQVPTEATWTHHVLKVPSSLQVGENVTDFTTDAQSGTFVSYYVGANSPIDLDAATDPETVYFAVRQAGGPMAVGLLSGETWGITSLAGAQRYPSIYLNKAEQIPFVVSNLGVGAAGAPHKSWVRWDDLGYNGGSWSEPFFVDSVMYEGVRELLYCNQIVQLSGGRAVLGENVWGQFTPEGFRVKYTDGGADEFSDPMTLWSIFDEGETMVGGFIAQNILLAGANDYVFVGFCGKYGETDFDGPEIGQATLSSFSLEQPWIVSCPISDLNGVGAAMVNWNLVRAGAEAWDYAEADSATDVDDLGNGTYWFTMPSDSMNGLTLQAGDSVWFYVDALDQLNNYAAAFENLIIVGEGWRDVRRPVTIPEKIELGQNFPNPFNNSTMIPFALNKTERIKVQVWDLNGRLISTLVDGMATAGRHTVSWNPTDVGSGIYIYTLETKSERFVGKMTLVH